MNNSESEAAVDDDIAIVSWSDIRASARRLLPGAEKAETTLMTSTAVGRIETQFWPLQPAEV